MKNFIKILLLFVCSLTLSGCTIIGFDAQDLISPPTSNKDQQTIYNLLKGSDSDLNFVYPTSGEYRSAVILEDMDNDEIEDAMGFTEDPNGGIKLQFMKKIDDTWCNIGSFNNSGIQVDRVLFGDFTGDGENEIIVGWGSTLSLTATISIFKFENDTVTEYPLDTTYNEMILTDFDNDGTKELFTACVFTSTEEADGDDLPAIGRIYKFENEKPTLKNSIILNSSIIRYTSTEFKNIYTGMPTVLLDGVSAEGNTVTQILYMNNNRLSSYLDTNSNSNTFNNFTRPSSLNLSLKDINDDNMIEFPLVTSGNKFGKDEYADNLHFYVDWIRFYDGSYKVSKSYIINTKENFMFEYNNENDISCEYNSEDTYCVKMYTKNDDNEILTEKILFMIMIFDENDWENAYQNLYTKLFTTSENKVYTAIIYDQDYNDIVETIKSINP